MSSILRQLMMLSVAFALTGLTVAEDSDVYDHPGYRLLINKPFVPSNFDQEIFDNSWRVWPTELRNKAEQASPTERREMAFARYGLTVRPNDKSGKPLQFVVGPKGRWHPNCFTCHGGKLNGRPYPGLPNNRYSIQTLFDEMALTRLVLKGRVTRGDISSRLIPLGTSRGTTNAVIFGILLGVQRDNDLNIVKGRIPKLVHHDMDAPPWWYLFKRERLYLDTFAVKSHRAIMQFALDDENGPEKFREWESDFKQIYAWINSLRPPKFGGVVDTQLARTGKKIFNANCAKCHGTYGHGSRYQNNDIPIDEIGTDPLRFKAITGPYRKSYEATWFAEYGKHKVVEQPEGYTAPPLDGVWASAPYLHNGSVPTLWHVLNPDKRPRIWRMSPNDDYDLSRVGLVIKEMKSLPSGLNKSERREYFDTSKPGKSAEGHDFPTVLSTKEREAVLEYLKTL